MSPLVQLIIQEAPSIIALIRSKHASTGDPMPTSEEVLAALEVAFTDSFAKDQMLKAALQAEIDKG